MKKKLTAVVLTALMLLGQAAPVPALENPSGNDAEDSRQVVIYHTNDTHGYLADGAVPLDMVAGLKASSPDSILVDAGDATQGLPLASITRGSDVIELMNLAGYDLMAAGNHEFDFGTQQLLSNAALADFPILASNVFLNGGLLLAGVPEGNNGCHTVIERDGLRIGFFGISTADTASSTNPEGISGLEFQDETEAARREIDELEAENVDAIVAVCHMGDTDASCTSQDLAASLTGEYQGKVDAIIDGHSHTEENTQVNDILIAQAGSNLNAVGKLTLTFEEDQVSAQEELLTPEDISSLGIQPQAEVTEKLQQVQASQSELLNQELGELETTLWSGQVGVISISRIVETNYGDLAADAFRQAGERFLEAGQHPEDQTLPVIGVENGGGIREAVSNGPVTLGDLISTFPFSNTLYMKKVTPEILYEVMEHSASYLDGQDPDTGMLLQQNNSGGFLQISGFTVEYNPDAAQGSRVTAITLDGQTEPLSRQDSSTQILMAGNNYIMSGGSDYSMLSSLEKYGEAGGELEIIQDYLEQCLADGTISQYAGTQNRILLRGNSYEPGDYTVSIQITDQEGNPLAQKELSYRVDGQERINGITDETGKLNIQVSNGSHGIRLADSQNEIYVDNYAGIGIVEDSFREFPTLVFLSEETCGPVPEPSVTPAPSGEPSATPIPSGEPSAPPAPSGQPGETPGKTPSTLSPTEMPSQAPDAASGTASTAAPSPSETSSSDTDRKSSNADTGDAGYGSSVFLLAGSAAAMILLLVSGIRRRSGE